MRCQTNKKSLRGSLEDENEKFLKDFQKWQEKLQKRGEVSFTSDPNHMRMIQDELEEFRRKMGMSVRDKKSPNKGYIS